MTRKILIVGATGNQGKALISSLQSPSSEFELLALTRNVSSPSAAALKVFPNVRVVEGDLDKPESVRKVFESEGGKAGIWGVIVVLAFPGMRADYEPEAKQGIVSGVIPMLTFVDFSGIDVGRLGSGEPGLPLYLLFSRTRW